MGRKIYILLGISLAVLTAGCAGRSAHLSESDSDSMVINAQEEAADNDITAEAIEWTDSVCGSMDERQRVGQLFMPAIYARTTGPDLVALKDYMNRLHVGGVILLKGDISAAAELVDTMLRMDCVNPFVAIDAEWGLAMRLKDAPRFPMNGRLGLDVDENRMYEYGREIAEECRRIGINMVLGPVLDVARQGSFIGRRSFGSDRMRVADLGVAYARGLEDGNVISVAKHFPGHGGVGSDSHKGLPVIYRSLNQLDSVDLYPFRRYVESGLTGVMIGHLYVPALDYDKRPAGASRTVVTDLLRDGMRFNRLVLTDAWSMEGAAGFDVVESLRAGVDIVLAPVQTGEAIESVLGALRRGELSRKEIDDKVKRILMFKYLFSIHDQRRVEMENIVSDVNARTGN